jgi:hypothetical protein
MTRRRALWLTGAASLALFVVLTVLDLRLRDAGGPGIVGFELAGSEERVAEILDDWAEDGRDAARASLWIDFPFLLAYGAFLTLAVAALRDRAKRCGLGRLAAAGVVIVALPATAAAFDAIEDVGLLVALEGEGGDRAPLLATICASLKFGLLAITAAYLLAVPIAARRAGRAGPSPS